LHNVGTHCARLITSLIFSIRVRKRASRSDDAEEEENVEEPLPSGCLGDAEVSRSANTNKQYAKIRFFLKDFQDLFGNA